MPVIENLEAAAVGMGLGRREAARRATRILAWMKFAHRADDWADTLPYGDERRVGIGRALAMAPRFVLLDEPAAGLSDAECDELMGLIAEIPTVFGCGVLLIEHNMRVIMGACDRIHVIESGRSVAEGPPEEIQVNPDVMRAYLEQNRPMLEVDDLHVRYRRLRAVRGVSLTVGEGEIVCLVGPNGAGKSSTLRSIAGLHPPAQGDIRLAAAPWSGWRRRSSRAGASLWCRRGATSSPSSRCRRTSCWAARCAATASR